MSRTHIGTTRPRVYDTDRGQVLIIYNGRQIRGWSYQNNDERRKKMMYAREYVEDWCDGHDADRDWQALVTEAKGLGRG